MTWKNVLIKAERQTKKLAEIETQLEILLDKIKMDPTDNKNQDKVMQQLKEIQEDYEELVRMLEEEPEEGQHEPTYDEMQEEITLEGLKLRPKYD